MKRITETLKEFRSGILAFLGVSLIFLCVFILYKLPVMAVLYPAILSALYLCLLATVKLFHRKKKHEELVELSSQPALTVEHKLGAPASLLESDYQRLLRNVSMELSQMIQEGECMRKDMQDYYAMWAHQIKTPIASMRLKLQAEDSQNARLLLQNLRSIDAYADMVMTYVRLNSETTDYVIKEESIKSLVTESVKKFSVDFIGKKLSLSVDVQDENVLTDRKWASVILEQIISNSIKYTDKGGISITYDKEKGSLCISDTGIGIDPANLPRIFEKGYTGFNGRGESHSSGIGLFVAKKAADNLHIRIECKSVVNEGTTMELFFPLEYEMYD